MLYSRSVSRDIRGMCVASFFFVLVLSWLFSVNEMCHKRRAEAADKTKGSVKLWYHRKHRKNIARPHERLLLEVYNFCIPAPGVHEELAEHLQAISIYSFDSQYFRFYDKIILYKVAYVTVRDYNCIEFKLRRKNSKYSLSLVCTSIGCLEPTRV